MCMLVNATGERFYLTKSLSAKNYRPQKVEWVNFKSWNLDQKIIALNVHAGSLGITANLSVDQAKALLERLKSEIQKLERESQ